MEPVTMIVTALIAGAVAVGHEVGGQMLKDAYTGLKTLIKNKLSGNPFGQAAVDQVSDKTAPDSSTVSVVKDSLKEVKASDDAELIAKAQALVDLLKQQDQLNGTRYGASLTGDGAIAQGQGAVAVGKGGVHVGGSNSGSINTGTQIDARESQGMINDNKGTVNQHYGHRVDTSGGAYVAGEVKTRGDFIGRDKIVGADATRADAEDASIASASASEKARMQNLIDALGGFWFSEEDLQELSATATVDWNNLAGATKKGKARALVHDRFRAGELDVLYNLVKDARPKLGL